MPPTPLDDLSNLPERLSPHIEDSDTQRALSPHFVRGEELYWYKKRLNINQKATEADHMTIVLTVGFGILFTALVLLSWGAGEDNAGKGPVVIAVLSVLWGLLIGITITTIQKRRQQAGNHYYGLTNCALYHVDQYRATRYDLRYVKDVQARSTARRSSRYLPTLYFAYEPPTGTPTAVEWKGVRSVNDFKQQIEAFQ